MVDLGDCRRLDLAELPKLPYFSEFQMKTSRFGSKFSYLHPLDGWLNHIIWTYFSPNPPYPELQQRVENGVEALFRQQPGPVIVTGNPENPDYTWICPELDLLVANRLMMEQGFSETIIAMHTTSRLVFMQDTDLEYCLLCRDPSVYPNAFPEMTDEALRREFWEQEHGTLGFDDVVARHINSEILPFTVEEAHR